MIDQLDAVKIRQLQQFATRSIVAGDLVANVLTLDLQALTVAPILELEAGISLNGLDIQDGGVSLLSISPDFGETTCIRLRCPTGTATIVNNAVGPNGALTFEISSGANLTLDNRLIELVWSQSENKWLIQDPFASGDYSSTEVTNDSGVAGATVGDALDTLEAAIPPVAPVDSVFGRTGAVVATSSDYDASQVDNDSTVTGATVKDALETLEAENTWETEVTPGYVLGNAPAYATFKSYVLVPGEAISIVGWLIFTRGSGPTVTMRNIRVVLNGRYQSSALPSSSPILQSNGDGPAIQLNWLATAIDTLEIQLRDTPGSTTDVTFLFNEVRRIP